MKFKQVFYLVLLMCVAAMLLQDAETFYVVSGALAVGVVFGLTLMFNKWQRSLTDWQRKYLEVYKDANTFYNKLEDQSEELAAWKLATSNVKSDADKFGEQEAFRAKYAQALRDQMELDSVRAELVATERQCRDMATRMNQMEIQLQMSGSDAWKSQLIDDAITLVMQETKYDTYEAARDYLFSEYMDKGDTQPSRYFKFYNTVVARSIANAVGGKAKQAQA